VHDAPRVAVLEPLGHPLHVRPRSLLGELARINEAVEELAARRHLHKDPEAVGYAGIMLAIKLDEATIIGQVFV